MRYSISKSSVDMGGSNRYYLWPFSRQHHLHSVTFRVLSINMTRMSTNTRRWRFHGLWCAIWWPIMCSTQSRIGSTTGTSGCAMNKIKPATSTVSGQWEKRSNNTTHASDRHSVPCTAARSLSSVRFTQPLGCPTGARIESRLLATILNWDDFSFSSFDLTSFFFCWNNWGEWVIRINSIRSTHIFQYISSLVSLCLFRGLHFVPNGNQLSITIFQSSGQRISNGLFNLFLD